ncbi:UNVERIFIED_CONTAM: hypothetical protein RMT77_017741 [Armadillidium vulgare]
MKVFFQSVIIVLVLVKKISSVSDFPCTIYSGECKADVVHDEDDDSQVSLEVSCQCKYRRDVSKNVTALDPIRCPGIPHTPDLKHLKSSKLRIQNCDVYELEFPLNILRILRRSKKFEILVENVGQFRLESDTKPEDGHPAIDALFKNSHISGLGQGWFTNTDEVSLKIEDSSIGILETVFINDYSPKAKVQINFKNTSILTIKNFAIQLPLKGKLSFEGGNISQIESDAISGGEELSFEGCKIASIQTTAINVFGLKKFVLDSCLVAKIDKEAIVEHQNTRSETSRFTVGEVSVIKNKFMQTDGNAFRSLCMEERLEFKHNFFSNVTSLLALKTRTCSVERQWWTSVGNNGFRCNQCSLLSGYINEQVCALYETGWCLCDNEASKESFDLGKDNIKEDEKNTPCRSPVKHFLANKCSHTKAYKEYLLHCERFSSVGGGISPRNAYNLLSSSSNRFSTSFLYYLISIVILL